MQLHGVGKRLCNNYKAYVDMLKDIMQSDISVWRKVPVFTVMSSASILIVDISQTSFSIADTIYCFIPCES